MENKLTREKIRELLSSDEVADAVMRDLNYIVNDDMMTGATLVCEMQYPQPGYNDMQLQVRICNRKQQFFVNYNNKAPHFNVDKNLNMDGAKRQTKYDDILKIV